MQIEMQITRFLSVYFFEISNARLTMVVKAQKEIRFR